MKLVALARVPSNLAEAAAAVAEASGLALAEARMRLARPPPALLARLDEARAAPLVAELRKAGLAALAVDEHCPTDKDRLAARTFALDDAGALFTSRSGDVVQVAWPDVATILLGARTSRSQVERTDKSTRFSVGMAVATGGLKMTRTSTQTQRSSEESSEQVVLVYARDGRSVTLAEHAVDFSFLGSGMQPSSTANMGELARRLRERAKGAFFDNRLLQLGRRQLPFVVGGESSSRTGNTTVTRTDTSEALDVLAEVMRQALAQGLLP
jgi:hypothetical protein